MPRQWKSLDSSQRYNHHPIIIIISVADHAVPDDWTHMIDIVKGPTPADKSRARLSCMCAVKGAKPTN